MKKVIIESPYAGDIDRNLEYARRCLRDSLARGEAPIASHLLYTQEGVLDDLVIEDRLLGINAGLEWLTVADKHVFYVDHGMSSGMEYALERGFEIDIEVEFRKLYYDENRQDTGF